ncbi:MAG: radical SAM protein [Candidatus Omnitrophota bacterium]
MDKIIIILVALYRYQNFPVRIMHPLLKKIDGIEIHTIFFKDSYGNIFDLPTYREEKLFVDLITRLNPKLVGFSVLSPYAPIAKRLTKLVKDNSSSLVLWGGIHPTIFPEDCINETDILCVGEGEGAITDLVKCLRDGKSYGSINNLWVKNKDNIIKNPMRLLIQNLDSIPFPSYGDSAYYFIDSGKITKTDPLPSYGEFWVQSSRGCPHSCSYCVNSLLHPLFKDIGPYIRRRSVNSVITEIKEHLCIPRSRTSYINFSDEGFGTEESWLDEFELRYKKEVGMPFFVEYNPKNIRSTLLGKLVSAGLDTVNIGIQTGSDHIRNQIFHRPGKNNELIDLAKKISEHNVKIKYDLILDNPYETGQSLKDTIELLLKLPLPLNFHLTSLQYFPNYPLTKMAIEDKHIKPEEARVDSLMKRTPENWSYVPRLLPYTKKQIFQNIIWLITNNRIKGKIVKFSIFGDSLSSKLCLNYLNLRSIILGKMLGAGGLVSRNPWILYILKDDFKTIYLKIRKRVLNKKHK